MSSGDGWTRCALGHRHWGLFGAAGLLVVRDDGAVLLQLRSQHTHNGNTWSVPGGARDADETPTAAALREAHEEVGIVEQDVQVLGDVLDDHGGWSYTTVIARLLRPFHPTQNFESDQLRWVSVVDVTALDLHAGFAGSWPEVGPTLSDLIDDAVRTQDGP